MKNGVVHWEIGATDSVKAAKFYTELFGWELDAHDDIGYHMAKAMGEGSIGGGISPCPDGKKPYVTFYVLVEDLQAALDKVNELGGKTVIPPTRIGEYGSMAWFSDPDGNTIGLWKANGPQ